MNDQNPFSFDDDNDDANMPLRLHCEPQRLATALRRLAEAPSAVAYGPGESAWPVNLTGDGTK